MTDMAELNVNLVSDDITFILTLADIREIFRTWETDLRNGGDETETFLQREEQTFEAYTEALATTFVDYAKAVQPCHVDFGG